jgi:hypothetical protein
MLLPRMGSKIGVVPPESALTTPATLTRVAQSHSSGFWEGWVCDEGCLGHLLTWVEPQDLPMDRSQWIRTSFEELRIFWVHASPAGSVAMLTDTAVSDSSLLTAVMQGVWDDAFLAPVARRVKESDNGT